MHVAGHIVYALEIITNDTPLPDTARITRIFPQSPIHLSRNVRASPVKVRTRIDPTVPLPSRLARALNPFNPTHTSSSIMWRTRLLLRTPSSTCVTSEMNGAVGGNSEISQVRKLGLYVGNCLTFGALAELYGDCAAVAVKSSRGSGRALEEIEDEGNEALNIKGSLNRDEFLGALYIR